VNIRDERTVAEQVQSGFRLAGWLLLTLAFIYALLLCAGFLVGKGEYINRFIESRERVASWHCR